MALLQCEMCCGEVDVMPDKSVCVCKYCGSTFTIPKELEKKGNLFNRANYLRQSCNFDKAIDVYESILTENCEDVDALWGLVLCRYGIEFVEDPKTGTRIPTCHRASRTSILTDPDYKSALQFADEEKRSVFLENAVRIDQIQKAIIALSDNQEKYDVFICYKESDEDGQRTIDSVLAQDLYNELSRNQIKTFFARKTLEGKLGDSYEPIIYSALTSAKVMVVLGTKPSHFEAIWVKNEWSRYLDFMQDDPEKHLIPAFRDMSAYQLPEEFMAIQALDMSRLGFMQDLCDGIKKLLPKKKEEETASAAPISKDNLYTRAMVFLGNREFYKAVDYFDKVLDMDPQYSRAYWGSLLATYQCTSANELVECTEGDWTEDARLRNALSFAKEEERRIYEDTVNKRITNYKRLAVYCMEHKDYEKCSLWCEKYLRTEKTDASIWWMKLLSQNKASNSNELFNYCCENVVDIDDMPECVNALAYATPEEREMYEKTVQKIRAAVSNRKVEAAYMECGRYMHANMQRLQDEKKRTEQAFWDAYKAEQGYLKNMRQFKAKLYQNNIFVFLRKLIIWALVAFAVTLMIFGVEGTGLPLIMGKQLSLLHVTGLLMLVEIAFSALLSLKKYFSDDTSLGNIYDKCEDVSANLRRSRQQMRLLSGRIDKADHIFKKYHTERNLTLAQIEQRKAEFNNAIGIQQ